ncbi:NAD(P)H-dependent oxidoreductase [Cupriavidus consociatus]|uniref:NAD(P)H-dependent oxidoreductase n=1 Tax=Cupriavidus consociatus TaxID=2821357 RepID=UPI001AE20096|nr:MULTISPECIES: NAD(P)H-dependent oxidoreductase [unclassified Cupriavidus]MBP0621152.1 NAD(P)H-dependent oxidoreductase [Cupriavidus sp. LEh25]MDK2657822.1 NAD(P)H-dependent oxidoreductase [Cupriavidus sp. LEh21]
MKVLVVHAHPEPQSFSSALKNVAVDAFHEVGHEVEVSDLYAMGFNPVASTADFSRRANPDYCVYALEQRNGVATGTISADIQQELGKLMQCDLLVLNFPLFWFSTPAILKGWIDRVLVSGTAYGGTRFYDRGGLRGKRALVSVTLGGQKHMFGSDGIHGPLESMLKHLLQGTLAYTGLDVLSPFVAWHVPYVKHDDRVAMLKAWRQRIASLEDDAPLSFPSLNDFDQQLYPLKSGT